MAAGSRRPGGREAALSAELTRAVAALGASHEALKFRLAALVSWSVIPSLAEEVLAVFADKTDADIPAWPEGPLQDFFDQGGGEAVRDIGSLVLDRDTDR